VCGKCRRGRKFIGGGVCGNFRGRDIGRPAENDPNAIVADVDGTIAIFDWGPGRRAKIAAARVRAARLDRGGSEQIIRMCAGRYEPYAQVKRTISDEAKEKLLPLQKRSLDRSQRAYQAGESIWRRCCGRDRLSARAVAYGRSFGESWRPPRAAKLERARAEGIESGGQIAARHRAAKGDCS